MSLPRLLVTIGAISALAIGCAGISTPQRPPNIDQSGGRCQSRGSVNWIQTVGVVPGANLILPEQLSTCTYQLGTDSAPYRINAAVRFKFLIAGNANHGVEGQSYSFTTKNTAYSGGGARADTVQAGGVWAPIAGGGLKQVGGVWFEEFELPLGVSIGWPAQSGKLERDSLDIRYWSRVNRADAVHASDSGVYVAATDVILDATPGTIGGPSGGAVGTESVWQFVAGSDSMGYRYDWYWNGVPQTTWKDFYLVAVTPTIAGTHTLRLDQKLVDTTYTIVRYITVPLAVEIFGPEYVMPWVTNSYTAGVAHGTPSYSYTWTVNGSYYGSGSSIVTPAWNQLTQHTIELSVTDANGAAGIANQRNIFVTDGGCDIINDPGCSIEERAPATGSSSTRKPPVNRPLARPTTPTVRTGPEAVRRP